MPLMSAPSSAARVTQDYSHKCALPGGHGEDPVVWPPQRFLPSLSLPMLLLTQKQEPEKPELVQTGKLRTRGATHMPQAARWESG